MCNEMKRMKPLKDLRERRNLSPANAAFFIGIAPGAYWDLEDYSDEPWVLTVAEFLRACILVDVSPEALLPDDAFHEGQQSLSFERDQYGNSLIASLLKNAMGDLDKAAETIGWEKEALQGWFHEETNLGEMPLAGLNDICEYLSVNTIHVTLAIWQSLGRR